MAFSLHSLKHTVGPAYVRPTALRRWVREMSVCLTGLGAFANESHSLSLIPALRVNLEPHRVVEHRFAGLTKTAALTLATFKIT
jgi:hypothetical protein